MDNTGRFKKFSAEEVSALLDLLKPKKHIIDSKKIDLATMKQKESIWAAITKEHNARFGYTRSKRNLKEKYQNLKRRWKINEAYKLATCKEAEKVQSTEYTPVAADFEMLQVDATSTTYNASVTDYDDDDDVDSLDLIPNSIAEVTEDNELSKVKIQLERKRAALEIEMLNEQHAMRIEKHQQQMAQAIEIHEMRMKILRAELSNKLK